MGYELSILWSTKIMLMAFTLRTNAESVPAALPPSGSSVPATLTGCAIPFRLWGDCPRDC